MALRLVTAPSGDLLTAEQLRLQCGLVGIDGWDDLLTAYLAAAVDQLEAATQRRFVSQVWEWVLPGFPCGEFPLPLAPVAADGVVSVSYVDANGAAQTLAEDVDFVVSPHGPTVTLRPLAAGTWPLTDPDAAEGLVVRFTVGEAADAVAPRIKTAARLFVAHLFANRGDGEAPVLAASNLPPAVEALIAPERW